MASWLHDPLTPIWQKNERQKRLC